MSGSGSQLANRERKQTPDTRLRRTNSDNKSTCSKLLPCADTLQTHWQPGNFRIFWWLSDCVAATRLWRIMWPCFETRKTQLYPVRIETFFWKVCVSVWLTKYKSTSIVLLFLLCRNRKIKTIVSFSIGILDDWMPGWGLWCVGGMAGNVWAAGGGEARPRSQVSQARQPPLALALPSSVVTPGPAQMWLCPHPISSASKWPWVWAPVKWFESFL